MNAKPSTAHDPSSSSWYVNDDYYADLVAGFTDF